MSQQLAFIPLSNESPYYEGLFAIADQGRTGHIGGKDAVAFLSRSKLPVDLLRDIWTMSDSPKSNSLDRANFYVAIRLIQLYQNGQSAQDVNLLAAAGVVMRPPYFEGVSGVSVPLPGAAAAPGAAPATQAPTGPATTPAAQQQPQQQQQQPSFQQQNGYQQQQTAQPTPQQQPLPLSQMAMQQQPHYLSVPQQPPQSTALTTQDLYVMFPHERSRYEAIFPQYEVKKDGFVYGGEAVALFSKSGLEKDQLRDVWNVVDEPVDNRLDRLEFAIAMHLIVCISKKNLPMPPKLPPSLQALKDAERTAGGAQTPSQQQQQPSAVQQQPSAVQQQPVMQQQPLQHPQPMSVPSSPLQPALSVSSQQQAQGSTEIASPILGPQGTQPPLPKHARSMMLPQGTMEAGMLVSLPGPPPIASAGGVSISDAFADLNPDVASVGYDAPAPAPGFDTPAPGYGVASQSPLKMERDEDTLRVLPDIASLSDNTQNGMGRVSALTMSNPLLSDSPEGSALNAVAATGAVSANDYTLGDDNSELLKLRSTLQKLQAENISLKAKLGDVSDEEKEVRREIHATVVEVGRLSQELTGLREQVGAAEASLIEATAHLKAQREKKGIIDDLIGDADQTLGALNTANEAVRDLKDSAAASEQEQAAAAAASTHFESDLFGFGDPVPPVPPVPPAPASMDASAATTSAPLEPIIDGQQPAQNHTHSSSHENVFPAPAPDHAQYAAVTHDYGQNDGLIGGDGEIGSNSSHDPYHSAAPPMGGTAPSSNPGVALSTEMFEHNPPAQPSPPGTSQNMVEIENMKSQAQKMDEIANEAEGIQYQLSKMAVSLKKEADEAEALAREKMEHANEKKRKKFGGGHKKAMKEAEVAQKYAEEKQKAAHYAQNELATMQAQAVNAKEKAQGMRQQAEQSELQAAAMASYESQVADDHKRAEENATKEPVPAPSVGLGYGGYEPAKTDGAPSTDLSMELGMGMGLASGDRMMVGGDMGAMGGMMSVGAPGGSSTANPSVSDHNHGYDNPFGDF